MKDYLSINQKAYDVTAEEFQSKIPIRQASTVKVVNIFSDFLNSHFQEQELEILELGPGSGFVAKLLSDKGYKVNAIEFSLAMAELAQVTAPKTTLIVDEFLRHDFKDKTFAGIFAVAFIHLFPREDAEKVAMKIYELLAPNGIALISTTRHAISSEGYDVKHNFKNQQLRFRKQYTQSEFKALLENAQLAPIKFLHNPDPEVPGKHWMGYIVEKA